MWNIIGDERKCTGYRLFAYMGATAPPISSTWTEVFTRFKAWFSKRCQYQPASEVASLRMFGVLKRAHICSCMNTYRIEGSPASSKVKPRFTASFGERKKALVLQVPGVSKPPNFPVANWNWVLTPKKLKKDLGTCLTVYKDVQLGILERINSMWSNESIILSI